MPKNDNSSFDPEVFLAKSGAGRTISSYATGQEVFAQGDPADAVFYIRSGKVKISVTSEQGKEAVIALLEPGGFFGEGTLAGQRRRQATATALTNSEVTRVEKSTIMQLIHDEPDFADKFLGHMVDRSIRTEEDLVDHLFNSSEKRLARTLLLLANFGKEGRPEPIVPKISQEMLAEMVGTTRSRISVFMNKFRKLGYIEYNGKIQVHSSLLNVVLYDNGVQDDAAQKL